MNAEISRTRARNLQLQIEDRFGTQKSAANLEQALHVNHSCLDTSQGQCLSAKPASRVSCDTLQSPVYRVPARRAHGRSRTQARRPHRGWGRP